MFNRIAYCLGITSSSLTPEEVKDVSFITKEADDQWTIVDLDNKNKDEESNFPTPPPSPKMECSWLITPPPCFDADENGHMEPESPRENLLIEHPSMFVKPRSIEAGGDKDGESATKAANQAAVKHQHRPAPTSLRRSQRKAARDAVAAMATQQRRRHQFKHTGSDVARRNNKAFQKMRQIVHQPRKHC